MCEAACRTAPKGPRCGLGFPPWVVASRRPGGLAGTRGTWRIQDRVGTGAATLPPWSRSRGAHHSKANREEAPWTGTSPTKLPMVQPGDPSSATLWKTWPRQPETKWLRLQDTRPMTWDTPRRPHAPGDSLLRCAAQGDAAPTARGMSPETGCGAGWPALLSNTLKALSNETM